MITFHLLGFILCSWHKSPINALYSQIESVIQTMRIYIKASKMCISFGRRTTFYAFVDQKPQDEIQHDWKYVECSEEIPISLVYIDQTSPKMRITKKWFEAMFLHALFAVVNMSIEHWCRSYTLPTHWWLTCTIWIWNVWTPIAFIILKICAHILCETIDLMTFSESQIYFGCW